MKIDWNLLRCAFGKHELGRILHDDTLDEWVRLCKFCGKRVVVSPTDATGKDLSPHDWIVAGKEPITGEHSNGKKED